MSDIVDGLRWAVSHVFLLIAGVLVAFFLYVLLFVGDNSALNWACRAIQTPIARHYYSYIYYPAYNVTEGIAAELGYTLYTGETNLSDTGSTGGEIDSASSASLYTTGWY